MKKVIFLATFILASSFFINYVYAVENHNSSRSGCCRWCLRAGTPSRYRIPRRYNRPWPSRRRPRRRPRFLGGAFLAGRCRRGVSFQDRRPPKAAAGPAAGPTFLVGRSWQDSSRMTLPGSWRSPRDSASC